ncbi:MAG: hypothetical protein SFY95_04900, partial [Planctomycetota bacterium]|nr:hypothetical protein [Planctomycetota bacterium]
IARRTAQQSLAKLVAAGLVEAHQSGRKTHYVAKRPNNSTHPICYVKQDAASSDDGSPALLDVRTPAPAACIGPVSSAALLRDPTSGRVILRLSTSDGSARDSAPVVPQAHIPAPVVDASARNPAPIAPASARISAPLGSESARISAPVAARASESLSAPFKPKDTQQQQQRRETEHATAAAAAVRCGGMLTEQTLDDPRFRKYLRLWAAQGIDAAFLDFVRAHGLDYVVENTDFAVRKCEKERKIIWPGRLLGCTREDWAGKDRSSKQLAKTLTAEQQARLDQDARVQRGRQALREADQAERDRRSAEAWADRVAALTDDQVAELVGVCRGSFTARRTIRTYEGKGLSEIRRALLTPTCRVVCEAHLNQTGPRFVPDDAHTPSGVPE